MKRFVKNKSLLQTVIGIIITIGIGTFIFVTVIKPTLSTNETQNTQENEVKNIELEEIIIKDIVLNNVAGITKYTATIEAKEETEIKYIEINLKDKEDEDIVKLIGYVGSRLEKGETKIIEASTDADTDSMETIDYRIVR